MRKGDSYRIADVMAKPREPGKGMRMNYMWQILVGA